MEELYLKKETRYIGIVPGFGKLICYEIIAAARSTWFGYKSGGTLSAPNATLTICLAHFSLSPPRQ